MEIAQYNQKTKNELINQKGEEYWDSNNQKYLIKHQNKKELLSKQE